MKAVMLMFDTLNKRMLSSYGCEWSYTPNFKRLAEKCMTFDGCYVGSLPCMPARRELHTGRYNFLHRSWGPLEPFDDSAIEIMKKNGVYTHLISNHQHYWEDGGCTYHNRYNSWEIVRGEEGDTWKSSIKKYPVPEHYGRFSNQDECNRQYTKEDKHPLNALFDLGMEFLNANKNEDNWFLQIESFDPHEPFFVPEEYDMKYPHAYSGPRFDWPDYGPVKEPEDAVGHCRLKYAALLSMCDEKLGQVMDFMDEKDMWKDTALIVNTDHGFLLGEHDQWAKCVNPFYSEVAQMPLFIWDPELKLSGTRTDALVQTIDIPPTLLDYFHCPVPKDMQGKSLRPVMKKGENIRDYALFGMHGSQVYITDGRYVYMRDFNETNSPLANYTLMPTHMRCMFTCEELKNTVMHGCFSFTKGCPVMRIEGGNTGNPDIQTGRFGNRLYDLEKDPFQQNPIEDKAIEERMIVNLVRLMHENDSPLEQFERLGLLDYIK